MFRTALTTLRLLFFLALLARPVLAQADAAPPEAPWYEADLKAIAELRRAGKPSEATSAALELLGRVEAQEGVESAATFRVLSVYWSALRAAGKSAEPATMQVGERALELCERVHGAGSLEYAGALMNMGATHYGRGDHAKAVALTERALALREQLLPENDPLIAAALSNLGGFRGAAGDLQGARSALERAVSIDEMQADTNPAAPLGSLQNLSIVCQLLGDVETARRHQERSTELARAHYGETNPNYAVSLSSLAALQSELGELEQSVEAMRAAVEILRPAYGDAHPETLTAAHDLALTLKRLGEYDESRRIFESALALSLESLGAEHPLTSSHRLGMATLLSTLGDHARADQLYAQALESLERSGRSQSLEYAEALSARAVGRTLAGDYSAAIESLERAVALHEALEVVNRSYVLAVNNLADTRRRNGEPEVALPIALRAVELASSSSDPDSPQLGLALSTLGAVQLDLGDARSAAATHERAWQIRRDSLGERHPESASSLHAFALALAECGAHERAIELALQAEAIGREHVQLSARSLSEREALLHARTRPDGLALAVAVMLRAETQPATIERFWQELSESRGLVFEEMARRHRLARGSGDAETQRLAADVAAANRRLAQLLVRGRAVADASAAIAGARAELERSERALAAAGGVDGSLQERERWTLQSGLDQLDAGTTLLTFLRFEDPLQELAERRAHATSPTSARYAALLCTQEAARFDLVALADAASIDSAVHAWQAQMRSDDEVSARRAGAALRAQIWEPLQAAIGDGKLLLIVPDGELYRVDFAALPVGEQGYQVESGPTLHLLSSERDLIAARPRRTGQLLALGDPDYDAQIDHAELQLASAEGIGGLRGRSHCAELSQVQWKRLPETRGEVRAVQRLWPGELLQLLGSEATEANLQRNLAGRNVLHIATHGFQLGESCERSADARGMGGYVAAASDSPPAGEPAHEFVAPGDENPLLLSGLVLAGANRRAADATDADDGILTAEEITSLDLSQVECAVLSACETGLGEARPGEGIFGLRRAFRIAGARTVVLSLWPVQDRATREWMQSLYAARWQRSASMAESVRQAAQEQLQRRRAAGASTHPRHWSGFVAVGDWR